MGDALPYSDGALTMHKSGSHDDFECVASSPRSMFSTSQLCMTYRENVLPSAKKAAHPPSNESTTKSRSVC